MNLLRVFLFGVWPETHVVASSSSSKISGKIENDDEDVSARHYFPAESVFVSTRRANSHSKSLNRFR